jgi:hypothetical protein
MFPAAAPIARGVSILSLLRKVGWRVRSRNRADCGLCRGRSRGTVAFTDRLWKCHRCNAGGDVFSFVCAVRRCNFPEALGFVADLAGISIAAPCNAAPTPRFNVQTRQRERVEDGANKLAGLEHALLNESRDLIHHAERARRRASERLSALACGEQERFSGEQEALWLTLQAAAVLLNTEIPAYTLLSFGAYEERARFVLQPSLRYQILAAVRWAGSVRAVDGNQIELPL